MKLILYSLCKKTPNTALCSFLKQSFTFRSCLKMYLNACKQIIEILTNTDDTLYVCSNQALLVSIKPNASAFFGSVHSGTEY